MSSARQRTRSAPSSAIELAAQRLRRPGGDPVGRGVGARRRRLARAARPSARAGPFRPTRRAQNSHIPGATPTSTSSGPVGGDRRGERLAQLVGAGHSLRVDAVAGGDRGGVEGGQVEPRRALDLLDRREPLEDRVLAVSQDEEGHRHVVGDGAPEGGDRVLHRALADARRRPGRSGWASWTPTAAASPKPSPPPAPK